MRARGRSDRGRIEVGRRSGGAQRAWYARSATLSASRLRSSASSVASCCGGGGSNPPASKSCNEARLAATSGAAPGGGAAKPALKKRLTSVALSGPVALEKGQILCQAPFVAAAEEQARKTAGGAKKRSLLASNNSLCGLNKRLFFG